MPGESIKVATLRETGRSLLDECGHIREALRHNHVRFVGRHRSRLERELRKERSEARDILSRDFWQVVVCDSTLGLDGGSFFLTRLLHHVRDRVAASFGLDLDEQFHSEQIQHLLRDQPPSLLCFLQAQVIPPLALVSLRGVTEEGHRVLYLGPEYDDTASGERVGGELRELEIRSPRQTGSRVPLTGRRLTLGRAPTNDLSYPDDVNLSRRHLMIERDVDGWAVTDLGSRNGTYLNGSRVQFRQRLQRGDRLTAGGLTIAFVDPGQSTADEVVFAADGPDPQGPADGVLHASLEGILRPTGDDTPIPQEIPRTTFDSPVVRTLIRAGRRLAGPQPLEQLYRVILELTTDALGTEHGALMILEGDKLVTRALRGDKLTIGESLRDQVLGQKTSILSRTDEPTRDATDSDAAEERVIRSLMASPLETESRVLGMLYVELRSRVREFTSDDLNLLAVLANLAAIRVESARHVQLLRQQERRTLDIEQAGDIQRSILPATVPHVDGLDLAARNTPCETVGADYYDFLRRGEGRWAVTLGDVAGKGTSAALLMSSLQARVQLLCEDATSPVALMRRLNRSVASKCPINRFLTLFFCDIDLDTGKVTYSNAGHKPPLLVRPSGEVTLLEATGTALGIFPELDYAERTVELAPGDLIAIHSDGVTEAFNPDEEEFGLTRLGSCLVEARDLDAAGTVERVFDAMTTWMGGGELIDDVTLVILKRI